MMLHAIASSPGNDGSRAHHGSPSGLRRRFAGGFLRSARALAAAALLALSGSLALPANAQAEVLVSNIGQTDTGSSQNLDAGGYAGQAFSSREAGGDDYTLTSIDNPDSMARALRERRIPQRY